MQTSSQSNEAKRGALTSEFLQSAVAGIAALYAAFASAAQPVQITGLVCLTAITCVFIWSRTQIKNN